MLSHLYTIKILIFNRLKIQNILLINMYNKNYKIELPYFFINETFTNTLDPYLEKTFDKNNNTPNNVIELNDKINKRTKILEKKVKKKIIFLKKIFKEIDIVKKSINDIKKKFSKLSKLEIKKGKSFNYLNLTIIKNSKICIKYHDIASKVRNTAIKKAKRDLKLNYVQGEEIYKNYISNVNNSFDSSLKNPIIKFNKINNKMNILDNIIKEKLKFLKVEKKTLNNIKYILKQTEDWTNDEVNIFIRKDYKEMIDKLRENSMNIKKKSQEVLENAKKEKNIVELGTELKIKYYSMKNKDNKVIIPFDDKIIIKKSEKIIQKHDQNAESKSIKSALQLVNTTIKENDEPISVIPSINTNVDFGLERDTSFGVDISNVELETFCNIKNRSIKVVLILLIVFFVCI